MLRSSELTRRIVLSALVWSVPVAAVLAAAPRLSSTDLVGAWTCSTDSRKGAITFSADANFEQAEPPRAVLKGRWQLTNGALIRAYLLSDAQRAGGQRELRIDIIVEAAPDRIVLRGQTDKILTILSRAPAASPPAPTSTGVSAFVVLGLAVAVLVAIVAAVVVFRRRGAREQRIDEDMWRPSAAPRRESPRSAAAPAQEPSEELMAAVWEAVKHGMESIQELGGPLRPFMFRWKGEERLQSVLMGESMEDSVAMGKEMANGLGDEVDGCVIAWDGYVTIAGDRSDALFFHAQERGEAVSHVLVQRYAPSAATRFEPTHNIAVIGQEAPLFASKAARRGASWGPLVKQSRADVRSIVVRDQATGLQQVHFIVTVGPLEHAREAILEAFDTARAGYGPDPDFGGELLFIVYSDAEPGTELAPDLAHVKSTLQSSIERRGLKTAKGRPFRVQVEQRRSAF